MIFGKLEETFSMIIQFGLEIEERTFPEYIKIPEEVNLCCNGTSPQGFCQKKNRTT